MSFQNDLNELMGKNNPIAQVLAQKIKNINDAFASGDITADEAKNLLNDIDVAKQLVELANDLETKILLQKVVDGLTRILGSVL